MDLIRAQFSGSWYPGSGTECIQSIEDFLQERAFPHPEGEFSAAIVPHAGWYFSGSVACNAIQCLQGPQAPDLVVIMGKHMRPTDPATILTRGTLETPLGPLPVAGDFASLVQKSTGLTPETPGTYQPENTIELQLPFVRHFFGEVPVVPMGIPCSGQALRIGESIVELAENEGLSIKLIGSTDLTHYGPSYGFEPAGSGPEAIAWVKDVNDKNMVRALTEANGEKVLKEAATHHNACCSGAAAALLAAAARQGCTRGELIQYTTSFDRHPSDSFVGYAGVVYKKR